MNTVLSTFGDRKMFPWQFSNSDFVYHCVSFCSSVDKYLRCWLVPKLYSLYFRSNEVWLDVFGHLVSNSVH